MKAIVRAMRLYFMQAWFSYRALFLWNNEYIVSLIAKNREVILPLVYSAMQANADQHWNTCAS